MSVNTPPPSAETIISPRASLSTADPAALDHLDQQLKRLSDDVLPQHPYLLTLPTNAPYHLGPRSANNWAVGYDRPFGLEEQELQYVTFLTHHNTDSLLLAVGDWSDETGRMMADHSTAPSTEIPRETVARKKISLNDYKNQKITSPATSHASHEATPRDPTKLPMREEPRRVSRPDPVKKSDKNQPPDNPSKSHPHLSPGKGPKKRPSTSDIKHLGVLGSQDPDMHSSKKPRLSPEKEPRREVTPSKSNTPKLPALLSPTLPPTSTPRLPRLLSPTLPPDIEKELARLGDQSPIRTSPKHDTTTFKSKRDESIPLRSPAPFAKESQSRLIVRLRYGKANRRWVEGLLKFTGGKKKVPRPSSPTGQDTDTEEPSRVEKRRDETTFGREIVSSDRSRARSKRELDEGDSAARAKDPKGPGEKPQTGASHPPRSIPNVNDKSKSSTSLTPVKASMARRNGLGEGEGSTPINPASKRTSTDSGARTSPSQSEGRSRNFDRRAWRDEFQKFSNIGRELKHAAVRSSTTDEKLAAVTAIEAIMGFILAFVADDQSKTIARQVGDSSSWQSIIAYWRVVMKNSTSYPILHSLCLLLGAVSYGAIHSLDLDRLAASPLPGEHTPVPTPGSDGSTMPSDENKKSRREFLELKNRLPESFKESQKLWIEGTRGLSEDTLRREFPSTWSSRSHNHAERGRTVLKPGEYVGDYFLPLGGITPPIEVVRFGWSLLQEWCTQEKVDWKSRLGL
ncbi:hypothetical protein N7470_000686 [Penicillium chermesinum]|nr:hypothetical protein N7470_000686 [Penicillium chermesinum]